LEAKGKKVPDTLRAAAVHDPLQNATAEHVTGYLFGCILELSARVTALTPATAPAMPVATYGTIPPIITPPAAS